MDANGLGSWCLACVEFQGSVADPRVPFRGGHGPGTISVIGKLARVVLGLVGLQASLARYSPLGIAH